MKGRLVENPKDLFRPLKNKWTLIVIVCFAVGAMLIDSKCYLPSKYDRRLEGPPTKYAVPDHNDYLDNEHQTINYSL